VQSLTFASAAFGLGMTFVIERTYAAHLTLPEGNEGDAPLPGAAAPAGPTPSSSAPARATAPAATTAPAAPAASLAQAQSISPNASPEDIAAGIAEALRKNQVHRLAESVERGLAADKSFFVSQPDSTLVLAKRLDAQRRSDLALRIALPYLKTHRGHRQHFTTALLVADVLTRDPQRLSEAARFLAQVKAIYPREPMLDQMIRKTDDAIAAAQG
jgi:hypothetical protein